LSISVAKLRWAGRLTGVTGITNSITVAPSSVDALVTHRLIEQALQRRIEPQDADIEVWVDQEKVSLRGRVRSWVLKRTALAAAEHAPGVQIVLDELIIGPAL